LLYVDACSSSVCDGVLANLTGVQCGQVTVKVVFLFYSHKVLSFEAFVLKCPGLFWVVVFFIPTQYVIDLFWSQLY
jgi:hypothetical protein